LFAGISVAFPARPPICQSNELITNPDWQWSIRANPAILENLRVLVVDDNETNRQILQKSLEYRGMRPPSPLARRTLLRQARLTGTPFVLLIVDRHMPEIDGFMLVEVVRKSPEWMGLITVMLSSGGQRGDAQRCKQVGMAAYPGKNQSYSQNSWRRCWGCWDHVPTQPSVLSL
jgi:CheY-like chemotaxis protein